MNDQSEAGNAYNKLEENLGHAINAHYCFGCFARASFWLWANLDHFELASRYKPRYI